MARIIAKCPECQRLTFSVDTTDPSSPPGATTYFCTECSTVWNTWQDERLEIVKRRGDQTQEINDARRPGPGELKNPPDMRRLNSRRTGRTNEAK